MVADLLHGKSIFLRKVFFFKKNHWRKAQCVGVWATAFAEWSLKDQLTPPIETAGLKGQDVVTEEDDEQRMEWHRRNAIGQYGAAVWEWQKWDSPSQGTM